MGQQLFASKIFWIIVILLLFAFAPVFMTAFVHELFTGLGNLWHALASAFHIH